MYSHTPISPLFALVPVAGLLALVLLAHVRLRQRRRGAAFVRTSDLVWAALPALALVWASVWCAVGLMTAEPSAVVQFATVCVAASLVALWREELLGRLEEPAALGLKTSGSLLRALKNLLCLAIATRCSFLALETPWNAIVSELPAVSVALEYALLGLAIAGCYLLAQRHGGGGLVAVTAAVGIGLAQYFLALFKGAAILPSDVLGIGTAVAVSQNYTYSISSTALGGIRYGILAGMALSLARRRPKRRNPLFPAAEATDVAAPKGGAMQGPYPTPRGRVVTAVACSACGAAALVACVVLFTVPSYRDDFGVYIPDYWWALNRYSEYGFLPTFASAVQDLPITMPDGYSDESARELEASYVQAQQESNATTGHAEATEQFERLRPSIVAIMNESFCDLSDFDQLGGVYQGPEFLTTGTDDALAKGSLAVSVLGGGTCNTEFEFLTGTSMRFVGDGKYPYTLYDFSTAPSLARQLADLGYHTTALHPNKAANWNRDRVYAQMGFESTQFEESFEGEEEYHTGISDEVTYEHVLDILRSSNEPQFVFDVTMQNHSGYDTGKIPEQDKVDLDLPALDDTTAAEVDEYLACVNESDRALGEFLAALRQLDRPVVVVFFGDHQPLFTPQVNDAYFPDENDDLAHSERTHQTSYLVWANYEVAGAAQEAGAAEKNAAQSTAEGDAAGAAASSSATSASQLAARTLWLIGAPLTDYQEAVLGAGQQVPALNAIGYLTADGTWHPTSEPNQTMTDLASIEYLDFARTVE